MSYNSMGQPLISLGFNISLVLRDEENLVCTVALNDGGNCKQDQFKRNFLKENT